MRRLLVLTVCATAVCMVLGGCERDLSEKNLFTTVSMQVQMPDGSNIVRMEVDNTLAGTYIRNLNTQMDFDFPLFVNGEGTVKLLKGVYLISFDATASFSNGKRKRVRYSGNSSPEKAVNLLKDKEVIVLKLIEL